MSEMLGGQGERERQICARVGWCPSSGGTRVGAQRWRAAGEKEVCLRLRLPSCLSTRTCASGLEPSPLCLPRHLIFLPFSHPCLQIHLAPFSAFLLHLPIFLSPVSPIGFSPSPPPPSPNSAPLCLSDLPSLPSLSFLLLRRGCDHRNISGAEEGAELGKGCRGAVLSMAASAAAGNKAARSSQSWCRCLYIRLVRGSGPASFPSLLMTLDQVVHLPLPQSDAMYHMRLFEESVR